jgi:hypothetical protein
LLVTIHGAHWTAHRPRDTRPFSVVDVEVPGQDVDALRAEITGALDLVNDIVDRDPPQAMTRADVGLADVFFK